MMDSESRGCLDDTILGNTGGADVSLKDGEAVGTRTRVGSLDDDGDNVGPAVLGSDGTNFDG